MHGSDIIDVCRGGGTFETIRTEDLVPGDVIILPASGCTMVEIADASSLTICQQTHSF